MIETRFKDTEIGKIPEDWEVVHISDLAQNYTGLTYSPDNVREFGTLVLRSSNIQDGKLCYNDNVFVDMVIPERTKVKKNDILVCVRNGSARLIGKCAMIPEVKSETAFGAFMTILRSKNNVNPSFVHYIWQSSPLQKQVQDNLGATINQITNKDIDNFVVAAPISFEEQSRIASALTSIDNLISSLDKLIEKKKNIKQGTMQQLLTGKKRLRGFTEPWVEKQLGDIEIKNGSMLKSSEYEQGSIPVIAGGKLPAGYHSKSNRDGNTITISGSGANAGYVAFYESPIFASDCSTINEQNGLNVRFIYFVLLLKQNEIYKCQAGGAQPHIHAKDIKDIIIEIPSSLDEQRAIASVLTSMDNEISALESKKAKYESIKQGMMQQLLTGKIRLIS